MMMMEVRVRTLWNSMRGGWGGMDGKWEVP
jgi:hypothetical protein